MDRQWVRLSLPLSLSPTYLILDFLRFYYDFFTPADRQLTPTDLKKIKKEMERIVRANYPITREEVTPEEAR